MVLFRLQMFIITWNNNSVTPRLSVLLVEEIKEYGKTYQYPGSTFVNKRNCLQNIFFRVHLSVDVKENIGFVLIAPSHVNESKSLFF